MKNVAAEPIAEMLLASAREIAPRIAADAAEVEQARQLPLALVAQLKAMGVFRMFVARRYGGYELPIPASLPIIETLAAADGSVGWTAMIGAHAPVFAALLPKETLDHIYQDGPDVAWANSLVVGGVAEAAHGGYRVSGRWPLASGCAHADWMFGLCAMDESGSSAVRAVALPASEWRIEDTWRASGLRGSGSSHIALDIAFVPASQVFDPMAGESELKGPLYRTPFPALASHFGAVAVGIAQGAIEDVAAIAMAGTRRMSSLEALRDSQVFQCELGRAEADVRAARALLYAQADKQWAMAKIGPIAPPAWVQAGQAMAWIAGACARAVDACYGLAGSAAVYDASPLQRRLRDIHAITQHRAVSTANFTEAGAALAGQAGSSARSA